MAGFVFLPAWTWPRQSANRLLGTGPTPETRERIIRIARSVEGVINVHDLIVHDYGIRKSISLHIEVDHDLSLFDAHQIANTVEDLVEDELFCDTVVHVDPQDPGSVEQNPG